MYVSSFVCLFVCLFVRLFVEPGWVSLGLLGLEWNGRMVGVDMDKVY